MAGKDSYNMCICGVGGQGIIKTSVIIGEAAMNQGFNVVLSEIHGMSQREGSVSTELRIGDFEGSILPDHSADMLLSFEPIEIVRALNKANKDTKLVFNTHPIIPSSGDKPYPNTNNLISILEENYNHVLPIDGNQLAIDAGNIVSLNMVLLGAVTADDNFPISKESVIDAMKNNLKPQFHGPILIKTVKKELTVQAIKQCYYQVRKEDKKEATARLLEYYAPKRTLVFCNTKRMVEELAEDLKKRGFFAEGLHGDLTQNVRDRVMDSFKNGTTQVLIATDVAARGIDVDDVEAVINFDVPQDIEYYG